MLHTCFGYAAIVHDRPSGYPFLAELNDCAATHISLEAAQPDLDPAGAARACRTRRSCSACSTSVPPEAETPEQVADRVRRALEVVPPERLVVAPDCGMKYLPRELGVP